MTTTYTVSSEGATFSNTDTTTLNGAISTINAAPAGNYVIDITGDISLTSVLQAIDLPIGSTLDIEGNGHTLDGGGTQHGLFVYSGVVTIADLTLQHMLALGGAGGVGGGGGGAGLGGALFVADNLAGGVAPGDVTLSNVTFANDTAAGGAGGGGGSTGLKTNGGGGGSLDGGAAPFGTGSTSPDPGNVGSFGGGGASLLGSGGFGGGGGGNDGRGGFGGGSGGSPAGGGGGGLGAGGDIFVQAGASLTIAGTDSVAAGTVTGGAGGTNFLGTGKAGQALVNGIYLQGDNTLTFAPTGVETIAGVIGDDAGSAAAAGYAGQAGRAFNSGPAPVYTEGSGGIVVDGPGTLLLQAVNTYTDTTTIEEGTLELAAGATAGTGTIAFDGPNATLRIDGGTMPSNTIDAMAIGDTIDLRGLPFAAGATVSYSPGTDVLTLSSDGITKRLTLADPASPIFAAPTTDGFGGTQVGLSSTVLVSGLSNGDAVDGQTITLTDLNVSSSGVQYAWQTSTDGTNWTTVASDTAGTSDSYTPKEADEGATASIRVVVTDTNGGAPPATFLLAEPIVDPFSVSISGATLTGTAISGAQVGATLTATPLISDSDDSSAVVSYQWQSSTSGSTWSNISGATGSTFVVPASNQNDFIRVQASKTGENGLQTADSTAIYGAPVTTVEALNAAIIAADDATAPAISGHGSFTIVLGSDISLGATELKAINLHLGMTLDIEGNGYTLDGGGTQRGLFVYSGDVTIEDLTLQKMLAQGGTGGFGGGGGGAGLGGALFIADNAAAGALPGNVTLSNVTFANNTAAGGAGGGALPSALITGNSGGGGGGLGGAGGDARVGSNLSGGGGGGVGGDGGSEGSDGGAGGPGIIPNAAAGGGGAGGGGASGGGGGASEHDGFGQVDARAAGGGVGGGGSGGGTGGFGGGGGGGFISSGLIHPSGASGGFGGGGGGESGYGGFGGGGGGIGGIGGFGAGDGGLGGGGGLGAGGDIFVQAGASLTISGADSVGAGTVTAGAQQVAPPIFGPKASAQAFATGIYLQGNNTLTFAPTGVETIAGAIGDDAGSAAAAGYAGRTVVVAPSGQSSAYAEGSGGIVVDGPGTLVLAADNTYSGTTKVEAGTLEVTGSIAQSAVTVESGATFGGNGSAGAVTVASGGTFAPGDPSTMTVASLTLASGANFDEEIGGTNPGTGGAGGYDQTVVESHGTIALGGATLNLSLVDGFTPSPGDVFTIISNDTGNPVSGTFAGLPQGATFTAAGITWQISYTGGADHQDVTLLDPAPTVAVEPAASATWTEETPATTLSPSVTIVDGDSTTLASATVAITGTGISDGTFAPFGQPTGDTLSFSTAGTSITASYDPTTETLTLTGSDTLSHYQSVLDTVAFAAGENPTNFGSDPTRIVTWVINDGSNVASASSTVDVVNVNDPPTLNGTATGAQFTQGGGPIVVSGNQTVLDPDDLDLASATVAITTGKFTGDGDQLTFNTAGTSITASYNSSTETLLLTGTDTLAHYQSVINSVTFDSTSLNPTDFGSVTQHQVTWVIQDPSGTANGGQDTNSPTRTTTVTLTAVNQPPTLTGITNASFTENGAAAPLSGSASVSDPDNLGLASATVALSGGTFTNDGDRLAATATGNITVSYNSSTETLLLTGSDTLANYQSVLDSVTFSSNSANPTNYGSDPTRTVTWTLNDGSTTGTATSTVSITAVNNPPTLDNTATGAQFTQGHGAVVVSGAQSVSDPDDLVLEDATVSITTGKFAGDGDQLLVLDTSTGLALTSGVYTGINVTYSYNATTETLLLTGTDTLADYQHVLNNIEFNSTSLNPTDFGSVTQHQVTWVIQDPSGTADGGQDTNSPTRTTTVTLTAVNNPPTLGNVATSVSFIEEGGAVALSSSVTVGDPDNLTLAGATVSITSGGFTGDALAATTSGTSITASYNSTSETLVLSGSDTLAHYQSVLDTVTFNAGENPTDFGSDPSRLVTWLLNDGSGSNKLSTAVTSTIGVTSVNDPPTLSNAATTVSFTEEGAAMTLAPSASVSDPDSLTLVGGTVQIASGGLALDRLSATAVANITVSYNSSTQTLTLSGTDTLAHYQSVLDSVTFSSGENPTDYGSDPTRLITWQLNDGGGTANGGVQLSSLSTTTVSVTDVNDPPTLANVATSQQFTEAGGAVVLSGSVSVTDPDNLDLASATVSISGGTFANDKDVLAATAVGNVTVSYNSTTETLLLTGSDTLAHYQSVLDTVTFNSASLNPTDYGSDPTRTVTWVLNDGSGSNNLSTAQTTTVSITAVDNPPTFSNVATGAQFTQGHGAVVLSSAASVGDPDSLNLVGATVSITTGTFTGDGDVLAANTAGTAISASYNSTTETLTLSGSDTLADYQSVLDTVSFNSTSANPTDFGAVFAHQVTWVLNDGSGSNNLSSPIETTTVTITPVHQPPMLTSVAATDTLAFKQTITISPHLTVTDPDSLTLASATVAITAGAFAADGDVLGANVAGTSITASYNSTSETLVLSGSDTLADYTRVLDSVTFNSGANPGPARTITWTVNDGAASNDTASATTTISAPPAAKNDFNGNGVSDIVFQDTNPATSGSSGRGHVTTDPTSGDAQIMLVNNGTVATQQTLAAPGLSWHLVGSADFNHDGNADIVWQSTDGTPMIWTMNGTSVTSQITLPNLGSSWSAIGTGDFNGDGNPDIVYQNHDGTPLIETMNGTSVAATTLLPDPGASWRLVATGDFNGDGKSDLVFQNTDGTPQVWLMNGTTVTATALLADPGSNVKLIGTADFNHDGDADLLFQNTSTGAPIIWTMNGTSVTSQTTLAAAGSTLSLVGTGEYFGGSQPDLLFQNTSSGAPVIWTMSGTSVTGSTTLASPGGSNWHANTG